MMRGRGAAVLALLLAVSAALLYARLQASRLPRGDWRVTMTATGEELTNTSATYEIAASGGRIRASMTGVLLGPADKTVKLSRASAGRLWKALESARAFELPDYDSHRVGAPIYAVALETASRSHAFRAAGADGPYLKVVQAIQDASRAGQ